MKRLIVLILAAGLSAGSVAPAGAIDLGGTTDTTTDWKAKVDAAVLEAAAAGTTQFIAYMQARADLSPAASLATKEEKGRFVYDTLTSTARTSQASLLSQLATLGAPAQSFWISNSAVVTGGLAVLQAVASRADVQAVYAVGKGRLDEPVAAEPEAPGGTTSTDAVAAVGPSIGHVNADDVWLLGYRGQGAVVAGADTGVRWTHSALRRQYRGWGGSVETSTHDYSWHDAIKNPNVQCLTAGGSPAPCDDDQFFGGGHGTHTMGTIVGDDGGANQIGMAPDAKWIACRNMNNGLGAVPTYMDCMQWFIAPTRIDGSGADPSKAPDVVNNSWGCVEACAPPMLKDMIDASRAAGIFYAVSAGNDGANGPAQVGCSTVAFPLAVYDSSFTVGATNATNDAIASFSSRGPVLTNPSDGVAYRKPDIVAPGVGIRSALRANDSAYGNLSGTSMAGPHVAGLVALIVSANPALRGHVGDIERIIRDTAVPLTSAQGCGGDSSTQVPNNVFGYGRIDALAAVQLALESDPGRHEHGHGEALDPAHNAPIPCELVSTLGTLARSARNLIHVANVCGFVGTDIEFQSRTDANGRVRDYAFVGTMGAGTRIFDVTEPLLPRYVGGYLDPGWQNDVQVQGDLLVLGFDPISGRAAHLSDCLASKAGGTTRAGVDIVRLQFDPVLATLAAPLTFRTHRVGCYLTALGGGAHTVTLHPSGEWMAINTSSSGIEVVDLRSNDFPFVRKITSAVAASAHDVFFSRDGSTLYSAGVGSTRIVDVTDVFNREPTLIATVPNNPSAAQGADGHVVQISHQSDTTSDGRLLIVTDEKGGGLSQTACNASATGAIGGAHFWALEELPGIDKSAGATVSAPRKIGTWIYPNPTLLVDALDPVLRSLGRTERACTIHVYRAGGNNGQSPADPTGLDGVSRLPVNEIVSAHYGAGVWHIDVMSPPGALDEPRTTWGRTLGWSVMPGAETWSAKEYKGFIYAGDMGRGFDVYKFGSCDGAECNLVTEGPPPSVELGLPAQTVDVTKETALQQHPTEDFGSGRTGTTTWRVVKDTGNCCENHLGISSGGRLFDIGGSFINYTDDLGVTWRSVRPLEPLINGEGSMAMAPNGDVIAMTWDAYSGDHFVAYKWNAATGEWKTLTNKVHQVVYDRPWLTVIPGPFTDLTGKTVPYISIVQGGTGFKDPMWVSTDGLLYVEPSSLNLGNLTNTQVRTPFPIAADPSFDWIQPIRSAPVTAFGAGYAGANGGFLLDPATREWSSWRMPDGSLPPTYIQIDSAGRIHNVRSAGTGRLEYRISSDGGLAWTSTFVDLPFGGLTDFKVNKALGVSAVVLRINNQDWVYKFDVGGDAAQIVRRYRVGLGDNPSGVGIVQLTNPRMDFQTIAILPDGRVAVSFLDSTTFSHPPGTGMLGRITPALAIELDTVFEDPVVFEHLATGGGWMPTVEGGKLNFGFRAEQNADGRSGDLGLNDKGGGAKVEITQWSSIGAIGGPCGGIADGPSALQLTGTGTFNGAPAAFRVCVEDGGHGGKAGSPDRFYLECTGGCAYATSERVSQATLGGGNISVERDEREGGTGTTADAASGTEGPATLILDPLLLDELAAGSVQTFTVRVYDAHQNALSGASVTITTASDGGGSAVTALTDASGLAVLVLTALGGDAEYVASSGNATSNTVQVSAILAP